MSLAGHYWTVAPRFAALPPEPTSVPWALDVDDPRAGTVRLSGRWSEAPGAREALLLLHGLAGCADSRYARLGAAAALERGMSCLRFNMRGSELAGEDYYHAGLSDDLVRALDSPELAPYERVHVLGYSLGGHLALRLAAVHRLPRLGAVAAICAPLDLEASQQAFDRAGAAVYRLFVLRGLKAIYAAVAARREVPLPVAEVRRIRTIFDWDERVVAPRWGFAGALDYYRRASVAPHLADLAVPALLVAAEDDPMVPAETLRPVLDLLPEPEGHDGDGAGLHVRWLRGAGHLGFPRGLRLERGNGRGRAAGEGAAGGESAADPQGWSDELEAGLDAQVVAWLQRQGRSPGRRAAPAAAASL